MKARAWMAMAVLTAAGAVQAGEVSSVKGSAMGCDLRLSGAFEVGDADALAASGARLCLDSAGGGLSAAVALAEAVAELGLSTAVESGARCLGTCGLVFLAGQDRALHPDARLEIGLPGLPEAADPAEAHAAALRAIGRFWHLRREGADLPDSVLTSLLATPPGEGFALRSVGQAARWRIRVPGVAAPDGDVAPALSRACGTVAAGMDDLRAEDVAEAARQRDFDYSDFGPAGAVARGDDCTVRLSADSEGLGGAVETAQGSLPLTAALLHPPQTRLADLPRGSGAEAFLNRLSADARQALAEVDFDGCWLLTPDVRVANVEDYVNLRAAPGFGAEVLRQVPLGEGLRIVGMQSLLTPGNAEQARQCLDACNDLALSPEDQSLRGRVGGCIRSNVFWYEVRDARQGKGFVSRKFLAP